MKPIFSTAALKAAGYQFETLLSEYSGLAVALDSQGGKVLVQHVILEKDHAFQQQFEALKALSLPLWPKFLSAFASDGENGYVVMEYADLLDLYDATKKQDIATTPSDRFSCGPYLTFALQLAAQLADSLRIMHEQAEPLLIGTFYPRKFFVTAAGRPQLMGLDFLGKPRTAAVADDVAAFGEFLLDMFLRWECDTYKAPKSSDDQLTKNKVYDFYLSHLPLELAILLRKMMVAEPEKRPSMALVAAALPKIMAAAPDLQARCDSDVYESWRHIIEAVFPETDSELQAFKEWAIYAGPVISLNLLQLMGEANAGESRALVLNQWREQESAYCQLKEVDPESVQKPSWPVGRGAAAAPMGMTGNPLAGNGQQLPVNAKGCQQGCLFVLLLLSLLVIMRFFVLDK